MVKIQVKNADGSLQKEVEILANKRMLSQLEKQWIEIPNACRTGMCAACMCHIQDGGEFIQKDLGWEPAFPLWEDEVMTCIAWVKETDTPIVLQTIA